MQSVMSRIWTRVTVSISYDDNHHGHLPIYIYKKLICIGVFIKILIHKISRFENCKDSISTVHILFIILPVSIFFFFCLLKARVSEDGN